MKKNKKVNPLKYFNDNKAAAVKKVGGAMKDFKKSLKRFQGDVTGSQVSSDVMNALMDSANKSNMANEQNNSLANSRKLMEDSYNTQGVLREASERNRQLLENTPRNNQAAQARMNATISSPARAAANPVSKVDPSSYEQYKQQFNKKGGSVKKMQNGGKVNAPKKSTISDGRVNADGSKPKTVNPVRIKNINPVNKPKTVAPVSRPKVFDPNSKSKTVAPGSRPRPVNADKRPTVTKSSPSRVVSNTSSKKAASVSGKKIIKEQDGSLSINKKNTGAINKAHAAGKTVYIPRKKYGGSITKKK
jgi:hypothetical protein